MWGLLPLYWKALLAVPALEVLCHRAAWSFVFLLPVALFAGRAGELLRACASLRVLVWLCASAAMLSVNWLIFIWAVLHDRVLETSLGYYINPLLNMCAGVILFREQPSRAQWIAIALAVCGVAGQILLLGTVPWVALSLGGTFCIYGLLRKAAPVASLPGLCIETALMLPFALGFILHTLHGGASSFSLATGMATQTMLLAGSGLVTSIPLLLFAHGVRNISLITLGIMQYVSPSISFLLGVFWFHETFTTAHALSFSCIWLALALYSIDGMRAHGRRN